MLISQNFFFWKQIQDEHPQAGILADLFNMARTGFLATESTFKGNPIKATSLPCYLQYNLTAPGLVSAMGSHPGGGPCGPSQCSAVGNCLPGWAVTTPGCTHKRLKAGAAHCHLPEAEPGSPTEERMAG